MAPKGGKVNLAELVGSVGDRSIVDQGSGTADGVFRGNIPLDQLVANPRNPRDTVGDLSDLASIVDRQLQPATVVSRVAWLNLWPADTKELGDAKWVVVNGCRRLAAAQQFGRPGLDAVIRDSIANDRQSVLWAAIVENIDRRDFDILEEARAVELMVKEIGNATEAATRLGKSKGWVSQRRALLNLAPELQEKLRAGDIAVREARALAQVPFAEQLKAWQATREREIEPTGGGETGTKPPTPPRPDPARTAVALARALRRFQAKPGSVAAAVTESFTRDETRELIAALEDHLKSASG